MVVGAGDNRVKSGVIKVVTKRLDGLVRDTQHEDTVVCITSSSEVENHKG